MRFLPEAAATMIGSLPHEDREYALQLVLKLCPEIPAWPQLVRYRKEQMIPQFSQNLPGLQEKNGTLTIDPECQGFEDEFMSFFEEYVRITAGEQSVEESRFALTEECGKTFFAFVDKLKTHRPPRLRAIKGQITGPFTMLTSLVDKQKRYVLYDDRLSDMVVKSLSLQARWQVEVLKQLDAPVILFLDEPALAGFGSSAFISVSASRVCELINEVAEEIHQAGGVVGTHVCANTDWNLLFDSQIDIINFDAYAYFERFSLYKDRFYEFLEDGKCIAWGIVPTMNEKDIKRESVESLKEKWMNEISKLLNSMVSLSTILNQSFITPSCGCGSLSRTLAERVLEVNLQLSETLKKELR